MLVSIAALTGFRLRTQDISHTYLQSANKVMTELYAKPRAGSNLKCNEPLKLLKPLYGLSDSGDYWHVTAKTLLMNCLKIHPPSDDLAYFLKCVQGRLRGMFGTYPGDIISAGGQDLEKQSRMT